ncbi:hypothetical protein SAMN05216436_13519 [bacterium A37T11]|nr:hypothetical protein SAMN05216436_13519 [bacterium A37T11]
MNLPQNTDGTMAELLLLKKEVLTLKKEVLELKKQKLLNKLGVSTRISPPTHFRIIKDPFIDPNKWMPVKVAESYLGIQHSTMYVKLAKNELHRYCEKGTENQVRPRVWLLREEVEAYKKSHPLK